MIKLGDTVKIKDNALIGQICDVYDGRCYIDVDAQDIKAKGLTPDCIDSLFERSVDDIELIKSI